jgi:transposase
MAWRQGQSYSEDLRARVLAAVDGGMAARSAASVFRVSVSYIYKALIRRRRTGEVGASARRGHRPRTLTPLQEAALARHITAHPDLTLAALQSWLLTEHAVRLSNGAMWSAVNRLGLSFKNVWPAPSARGLCELIWPVCVNVSGLGALPLRPRWRSARPGPHKTRGVGAPFF